MDRLLEREHASTPQSGLLASENGASPDCVVVVVVVVFFLDATFTHVCPHVEEPESGGQDWPLILQTKPGSLTPGRNSRRQRHPQTSTTHSCESSRAP